MSTRTKPIRLEILTGIPDALQRCREVTGIDHIPFVDRPWEQSPVGHIDLFQRFTDENGQSIRLREGVLKIGAVGIVPVYLVRADRAGPFETFLSRFSVPMADGSIVRPMLIPPGRLPKSACHEQIRDAVRLCRIIAATSCGPRAHRDGPRYN